MKMNVYDFDGTIYDGDVTLDFFKYAFSKKPGKIRKVFKISLLFTSYFFNKISTKLFKERFLSVIVNSATINEDLEDFWNKHHHKIKQFYYLKHRKSDLIISASPKFLLESIAKKIEFELIATIYDLETQKIIGENMKGHNKLSSFLKKYPGSQIEEFYSDSMDDNPLASYSNNAFFVEKNTITDWDFIAKKTFFKSNLKSLDFLRFIFSGGVGTFVNFIISSLFSFHINPITSYTFGYSASLFVTFYLSNYFIFNEELSLKKFAKFTISYIPNFLILFLFVSIFIRLLEINPIVTYASAAFFGLPITYILVKLFTFNKEGFL